MKKIASILAFCTILLTLTACGIPKEGIVIIESLSGKNCKMEFSEWSKQNKCELSLDSGDNVLIEVVCDTGNIDLSIKSRNGYEAYTGNGLKASRFTMTVNVTGEYIVAIKGENATGHIAFENLSE